MSLSPLSTCLCLSAYSALSCIRMCVYVSVKPLIFCRARPLRVFGRGLTLRLCTHQWISVCDLLAQIPELHCVWSFISKTQRLNSTVCGDYEAISSELSPYWSRLHLERRSARNRRSTFISYGGTHLNCNYSTMSTPFAPLDSAFLPFHTCFYTP